MTWLDLTTKQHRKVHKYVNWDTLHPSLKQLSCPITWLHSVMQRSLWINSGNTLKPHPTFLHWKQMNYRNKFGLQILLYWFRKRRVKKYPADSLELVPLSSQTLILATVTKANTLFNTSVFRLCVSFSFLFLAVCTYLRQTKTLCSSCRDATTTAIGIHLPQMFWLVINQDSSMTEGTEQVEYEWTLQWEWNSMLGVYRNIANKTPC